MHQMNKVILKQARLLQRNRQTNATYNVMCDTCARDEMLAAKVWTAREAQPMFLWLESRKKHVVNQHQIVGINLDLYVVST